MSDFKYDSRVDTLFHIRQVSALISEFTAEMLKRAIVHDKSKLESPELESFDELTPKIKDVVYGSDEYKEILEKLKPALNHHYASNTHHPQFFENGIDGMDLYDLCEMLLDWKAAGMRDKNGDIIKSLEINKERFKISDQLYSILLNHSKRYLQ